MPTITKNDLVTHVMGLGLGKKKATDLVEGFIEIIEKGLAKDGKVQLVGLGCFETVVRPSRRGRNPSTGERMILESKRNVKFRAGRELKQKLLTKP